MTKAVLFEKIRRVRSKGMKAAEEVAAHDKVKIAAPFILTGPIPVVGTVLSIGVLVFCLCRRYYKNG